MLPEAALSTAALHADDVDHAAHPNHPVAPVLSLSSTYRGPHPDSAIVQKIKAEGFAAFDFEHPEVHIYSRYTDETRLRTEQVLGKLCNGHALTYSSGMTAAYAALLHYAPSTLAIRGGYHGVHSVIQIWKRTHKMDVIDLDAEYPAQSAAEASASEQGEPRAGGLLVWVETPLNPTGEARDIESYADRAHAAGGYLLVDSTFAPPPLQDPFKHGCDMVMHSGTKYMGGHSDLLAGVLVVKTSAEWSRIWNDRTYVGAPAGSLESWLLLRSLRTLSVRIKAQSETATKLVEWLHSLSPEGPEPTDAADVELKKTGIVARVWHASLQPRKDADPLGRRSEGGDAWDPRGQMTAWNACFAFRMAKPEHAVYLPHATTYFTPATSLGGVESLLEWRKGADPDEEPGLVRISVGLEAFEDLVADLRDAFQALARGERMSEPKAKQEKK